MAAWHGRERQQIQAGRQPGEKPSPDVGDSRADRSRRAYGVPGGLNSILKVMTVGLDHRDHRQGASWASDDIS
jgi:hypothetical protein